MKLIKGERVWIDYCVNGVTKYICTSKEMDRSIYFLYKVEGDKLEKILKSDNPTHFDTVVYANNTIVLD